MQVLIVEDEKPAANRLIQLLNKVNGLKYELLGVLDSVTETVDWLDSNPHPDILFLDIRLADGLSFEILEKIELKSKVIFTTAYDQYAVKAFRARAIDYLLKPIDQEDLQEAIQRVSETLLPSHFFQGLLQSYQEQKQKTYKERFLIKVGQQLKVVSIEDVSYFYSDNSSSYVVTKKGNKLLIDDTMDEIELQLNPRDFYRVSRKFIVGTKSITKIQNYSNSRLELSLLPQSSKEVIVSRERVKDFKAWLGG